MLLVGRWMVRQRKRQRIAAPVRVPRRDARRTRNRTVVMRQTHKHKRNDNRQPKSAKRIRRINYHVKYCNDENLCVMRCEKR